MRPWGHDVDWYEAAREYYLRTPDDAGVSALPAEWQRELVALMLVNREVNNGGYLQLLANHGREAYEYASRALRAISGRPGFLPDKVWPGERGAAGSSWSGGPRRVRSPRPGGSLFRSRSPAEPRASTCILPRGRSRSVGLNCEGNR